MIPFHVAFRPGSPLHQQVVFAAKKAIVSGQIRSGDLFPSVRALSRELKINPNTAHKVVTQLLAAGLLETRSGVGTVVCSLPHASRADRAQLLGQEVEQLVVEAKKLGIDLETMLASMTSHWQQLQPPVARKERRPDDDGENA